MLRRFLLNLRKLQQIPAPAQRQVAAVGMWVALVPGALLPLATAAPPPPSSRFDSVEAPKKIDERKAHSGLVKMPDCSRAAFR